MFRVSGRVVNSLPFRGLLAISLICVSRRISAATPTVVSFHENGVAAETRC